MALSPSELTLTLGAPELHSPTPQERLDGADWGPCRPFMVLNVVVLVFFSSGALVCWVLRGDLGDGSE